jgi:hypothetical protein
MMTVLLRTGYAFDIPEAETCRESRTEIELVGDNRRIVRKIPRADVVAYGRAEVLRPVIEKLALGAWVSASESA